MKTRPEIQVIIDCSTQVGKIKPFWDSTGFTPASLLLTEDMRQQITYWGSIPNQGIKYSRIHFLLELINVTFDGQVATAYDWSRLDKGIDWLVENHLTPIFELMGNPGGQFTSFRDDLQLKRWSSLVHDLAVHLQQRYHSENIEKWYFESWNEPDVGWWHEFPHDIEAFCNYYDACAYGLKSANPNLKIGGPGTCRTLSPLFCAFLKHCEQGPDYFRGGSGVPLDFISIHEKAAPANREDLTPNSSAMMAREKEIVQYIRDRHPGYASLPFMNNECDPQVGWRDFHTWHARPYYAAWVVKSAWLHLDVMIDNLGCNYALLGNDHGFIGSWGNRTLLTRFGPEGWIEDGQSKHKLDLDWQNKNFSTPPFSLVKKPVLNAMHYLAMLGDERLGVEIPINQSQSRLNSDFNLIATACQDGSITILLFHCQDQFTNTDNRVVQLQLKNFPHRKAKLLHYRIDGNHGDLFRIWENSKAPKIPDPTLLKVLRHNQEPVLMSEPIEFSVRKNQVQVRVELPMHSVSLLQLVPKHISHPQEIQNLRADFYQGVHNEPEFLLTWDSSGSNNQSIFEIYYTDHPDHETSRIDHPRISSSACLVTSPGYYQVQTCDCWGQKSQKSPLIQAKSH